MNKYSYSARSGTGELIQGELEAASDKEVAASVAARGYIPISIKKQGVSLDFSFFQPRVKVRDLNILFRQLAVLTAAGVTLLEAMIAIEDQIINDSLKKIVRQLESDIGGGASFSQALAKHPAVFSGLIVAMVEAGEKSGTLDDVLNKITGFYEKDIVFRQKLQAALRYPLIVLVVLAIAFLVIVTFVIPRFGSIYGQLKADLPLPTRMLIALNQIITHYWWGMILVTGSLIWGFKAYIGTDSGRRNWDRLLLKVPVFGSLITKVSLSRFFRMLAVMISSGIPIVAGLETTVQTADNVVISEAILKIRDRVVAGSSLSAPMQENKLFPPTAVQMVAVGEKSGMLDKMLMKSADYFDEETDYMVTNLMSLLEPFVILFLGMLVLTLALGIFLPMWNLMSLYTK